MKTTITMITTLQAQIASYINEDMFNIGATILVIALCMAFVLALVKMIFLHRLKKKIIENGIPETLAESILKADSASGDANLKWCFILIGLGIGLGIVHYTTPLGLHSLAILSLCIAVGFFCYFIYTKRTQN